MTFSIHFNGVDDVVSELAKISQDLLTELQTLETKVSGQLSTWSGAAQDEYRTRKAEWDKAALQMQEVLTVGATTLGNVNMNYLDTEKLVLKSWSS